MSFWHSLLRGKGAAFSLHRLQAVNFTMEGWSEQPSDGELRTWRDSQGDLLSLSVLDEFPGLPDISDEAVLRRISRHLAQNRHAGLIEARVFTGTLGAAAGVIYKRLQKPAYVFTGMLIVPRKECCLVWTVVAGEHGITGVREAVVASELINAGKLTVEEYERSWSQDPYDPAYRGVDRSVLRFVSDDESYDERFTDHPLSKVRRVLTLLPDSVRMETGDPER